ncbi:uncharacterized protein LOC126735937 [Anthonomus grandis grandis]|uniref:uncharacterized protein LOC126735937 n=1 Tax=Anthonomus grandis grandis TaxID=2921223 RepID=UPI0021668CCF|nr:uncharacterized protein LOC126735937 [Anthonomus grandis grandis]
MGLLGGFRAKFSKDSVAKKNSKISKKNTVVCVGYRVFSEFQDIPQYRPISEPPVAKQPTAIKTVIPQADPNINGINSKPLQSPDRPVGTMIITNPTARKSVNKPVSNSAVSNTSEIQSNHLDFSANYNHEISGLTVGISRNVQVIEKPTPAVRSISNDKNSETEEESRRNKSLMDDIITVFAEDDNNTNSDEKNTFYNVREPGKSPTENIPRAEHNGVLIVDVSDNYINQHDDESLKYTNIISDQGSLTDSRTTFNINTIENPYENESDDNESSWYQETESSFQEENKQTITTRHLSSVQTFKTTSTLGATSSATNIFFASDDEEPEEVEPRPAPRKFNMRINHEGIEGRSGAEC